MKPSEISAQAVDRPESKTQIYLIRHGESQGNLAAAFIGHGDVDLSETGRLQAKKAAEYLQNIPADAIYSSDLKRAFHTAQYTAQCKGMSVTKMDGLREVFAGAWEGRAFLELKEEYPEDFGLWLADLSRARCTGGESVEEMHTRVQGVLDEIVRENVGKSVFIFCHGTPIRALSAAWQGIHIMDVPWAANASVTHAECDNGTYRVIEYGRDDFMGDLVTTLPDDV